MEINRQAMVEELCPEIMEKSLLADGYAPINKEKNKLKVYLAQDNWQNKSDILQEKALEWKKEMDEKIEMLNKSVSDLNKALNRSVVVNIQQESDEK